LAFSETGFGFLCHLMSEFKEETTESYSFFEETVERFLLILVEELQTFVRLDVLKNAKQKTDEILLKLFSCLSEFLKKSKFIPDFHTLEKLFSTSNSKIILETEHPYKFETAREELTFKLPNVTCFVFFFDPRSLLHPRHSIQITVKYVPELDDPTKLESEIDYERVEDTENKTFYANNLGKSQIMFFEGNYMTLRLQGTITGSYQAPADGWWGYKIFLFPLNSKSSSISPFLDVFAGLNSFSGSQKFQDLQAIYSKSSTNNSLALKDSLDNKATPPLLLSDEKMPEVEKWLSSSLFSFGLNREDLTKVHSNRKLLLEFSQDLIEGKENSEALYLAHILEKKFPVRLAFKDPKFLSFFYSCMRVIFSIFLRFSDTLQIASNFASEIFAKKNQVEQDLSQLKCPLVVQFCWQNASKVK
jgi:hypothetical protein